MGEVLFNTPAHGNVRMHMSMCVMRMHMLPRSSRGTRHRTPANADPDVVHLFEQLCQLQGDTAPCEAQRAVHYSVMGEGIGSGFHLLGHALMLASVDRRVLLEDVGSMHAMVPDETLEAIVHALLDASIPPAPAPPRPRDPAAAQPASAAT